MRRHSLNQRELDLAMIRKIYYLDKNADHMQNDDLINFPDCMRYIVFDESHKVNNKIGLLFGDIKRRKLEKKYKYDHD